MEIRAMLSSCGGTEISHENTGSDPSWYAVVWLASALPSVYVCVCVCACVYVCV